MIRRKERKGEGRKGDVHIHPHWFFVVSVYLPTYVLATVRE